MKRQIPFWFTFCLVLFLGLFIQPTSIKAASAQKVKLNIKKVSLTKTDVYTLRVYNTKKTQTVRFSTSDEEVVSVSTPRSAKSRTAILTATDVGRANVTASVLNKRGKVVKTLRCTVNVAPYAISVKFTNHLVKVTEGESLKLPLIIKPSTSRENPLFSSSNEDVVTVNSKGIITAVAPGEATITATLLSSGKKAVCDVVVTPELSVKPTPEPY